MPLKERGHPGRFDEIDAVHWIYRALEVESAQIGSGRPTGERNRIWGSIVVLARNALEGALNRLHAETCSISDCEAVGPEFDPSRFRIHMRNHGVDFDTPIPASLHIALRRKDLAKGGDGFGSAIDGPTTAKESLELLAALNHLRNGFAHYDAKKAARHPTAAEGVFWVPAEGGTSWTVQKPHAFSVLRYCQLFYRHSVLWLCGRDAALAVRKPMPRPLVEQLAQSHSASETGARLESLTRHLEGDDLRRALSDSRWLTRAIIAVNSSDSLEVDHPVLSGLETYVEQLALSDPIREVNRG